MRHTYCIFSQYLYLREWYSLFPKCLPNQSLNKLNEGSKLKLLGSANSNTYIDISKYINEYSELLISVTLGNTPYRITINIPPAELVDSDITYQSGSRASASIGTVVNVQCSRKRVLLTAVIVNDNDVLAYSTIRIYGRKWSGKHTTQRLLNSYFFDSL